MTTLADLRINGQGMVTEVLGSDEVSVRLLEMGLVPGTEIRVIGFAPLGDPVEIEVRGYRLSVRKSEAAHVLVAIA
ncbi:MAG: FeoA family protein [Planctomycetaceae bacterium]